MAFLVLQVADARTWKERPEVVFLKVSLVLMCCMLGIGDGHTDCFLESNVGLVTLVLH